MGASPMSDDEKHTARLLRREGKTVDEICRFMGRKRPAIFEAIKRQHRARTHEFNQPSQTTIPDHVLIDRDNRLSLAPRDLTAAVFGDPLPGLSALELRNGR